MRRAESWNVQQQQESLRTARVTQLLMEELVLQVRHALSDFVLLVPVFVIPFSSGILVFITGLCIRF